MTAAIRNDCPHDKGEDAPSEDKRMKLRYAGVCRQCGTELPARADAIYERSTKTVRCVECPAEPVVTEVEAPAPESLAEDVGVAGSSARRE